MLEMAIVVAMLNSDQNPIAEAEQHCVIENVIYESLGEDKKGTTAMQLVAEVTLNRVENNHYTHGENSLCDVVYQRAQFSWTFAEEGELYQYTDDDYNRAAQVVLSLMYEETPRILAGNVLHYINTRYATDMSWYDPSKVVHRYKNHDFLVL